MCLFTRFLCGVPLWNSASSGVKVLKISTTESTEVHGGKPQRDPLVRDHSLYFGRVGVADQG